MPKDKDDGKGDKAMSPSEALEEAIKMGRKRELGFALLKGPDKERPAILVTHPTKSSVALIQMAKEQGGKADMMVSGSMLTEGNIVVLKTNTDDVPGALPVKGKKMFKAMGFGAKFKLNFVTPSGKRFEPGDDEPEDAPAAAPGAPADDPEALRADLTARLKALAQPVKEAAGAGDGAGEKLAAGLKAAVEALAGGDLERTRALVEAVEAGLKARTPAAGPAGPAPRGGPPDGAKPAAAEGDPALKAQMLAEFAALQPAMQQIAGSADPSAAGKVRQLAAMFATEVERDLKKAGAVLGLLKSTVATESARLQKAGDAPGIFDSVIGAVSDAAGKIADAVAETAQQAREAVAGKVQELRDAAGNVIQGGKDAVDLFALGLPMSDVLRIVLAKGSNPQAVEQAKAKLAEMGSAGIPAKDQPTLLRMAETEPKAYAAALATFTGLDPSGSVDISPEAMAQSLKDAEAARTKLVEAVAAYEAARDGLTAAEADLTAKSSARATAEAGLNAALSEATTYEASLPPLDSMSPEEHAEAQAEIARLSAAADAAERELELAKEAEAAAQTARDGADSDAQTKWTDYETARTEREAAKGKRKAQEDKRGVIDAVSFGPLAPGSQPAFDDDQKTAFLNAYGKDPGLAQQGMEIARNAADPGAVAANIGFVTDKMKDGFADNAGVGLGQDPEAMRKMAANALASGGRMGQSYFDGFKTYLDSGAQHQPDPNGGLDDPLPTGETGDERDTKVARNRANALAGATMDAAGKVDFDSPEAKAAMDHMMFHPGSLSVYTPHMTDKMVEMKGLFADPAKGPQAQAVLDRTALPAPGSPGEANGKDILGSTLGKDPATLTDTDSKEAVMSAMMWPMTQGPVGSCFSSGPVRKIRETDPVRAMGEFSKIASTGLYTGSDGIPYPADNNPTPGEHPLLRSWEYSVATAAASGSNSVEKETLDDALFGGHGPGKDLGKVKDIVGAAAWNDGAPDPATGDVPPGIKSKLRKAIKAEIAWDYDANPASGVGGGGGGDGHSTDGGYFPFRAGAKLDTEAKFVAAIKDIALTVVGKGAGTPEGDAIIALIDDPDFIKSVTSQELDSDGKPAAKPWEGSGGGYEKQTMKILNGGSPANRGILDPHDPASGKTPGQRTLDVLNSVLALQATDPTQQMIPMGTTGEDANHAFNTLPKHPSMDRIKDPDSAAKIDRELLQPGKKIAETELPVEQAVKIFEQQINDLAGGWGSGERDVLMAAMDQRPTRPMTMKDLDALIKTATEPFRDTTSTKRTDSWKQEQIDAGSPPTQAQIDAHLAETKASVDGWLAEDRGGAIANAVPLPQVVIADTNWGGPTSHLYFVIAPDPKTGELAMYEKDIFTGKLTPKGANWPNAYFDTVD